MFITDLSIRRPVVSAVFSMILVVFGLFVFWKLPVRELPAGLQPPVVQVEQPNFMPDFGLKDAFEKSFAMMSNEIKGLRQDTVNGQEQLSNIKIFTERGQIAAGFDPGFGSKNL